MRPALQQRRYSGEAMGGNRDRWELNASQPLPDAASAPPIVSARAP